MATEAAGLDEAKVEEFLGKVIGDFVGAMTVVLALDRRPARACSRSWPNGGPATAAELARALRGRTSATRASGCAA